MKYEGDGWKIAWDRQTVLPELENGNNLVMRRDAPARGNIYDRAGSSARGRGGGGRYRGHPGRDHRRGRRPGPAFRRAAHAARIDPPEDRRSHAGRIRRNRGSRRGGYPRRIRAACPARRGVCEHIHPALLLRRRRGLDRRGIHQQDIRRTARRLPCARVLGRRNGRRHRTGKIGRARPGGRAGRHADRDRAGWNDSLNPGQIRTEAGRDVTTTLDRDLQAQIERTVLGPYNGAVVVLNRNTGEVLAMVSSKHYDNNLFTPGSLQRGLCWCRIS